MIHALSTWLIYNPQAFGLLALGSLLLGISGLGAWTDRRVARRP